MRNTVFEGLLDEKSGGGGRGGGSGSGAGGSGGGPLIDTNHLTEFFTPKAKGSRDELSPRSTPSSRRLPFTKQIDPTLIDQRRNQQLAIFLERHNFETKVLVESILTLKLHPSISPELIDVLPSLFTKKDEEEISKCTSFSGDMSTLLKSEAFLCHLYRIPRLNNKLEILVFNQNFENLEKEIEKNITNVKISLSKLHSSEFKTILSWVIQVANTLTRGTATVGFRLSSLNKLSELKSPTDRKTTLLHYLVSKLQDSSPDTIEFIKENAVLFTESQNSMASFEITFPSLIKMLWQIQEEQHFAEMESAKNNNNIDGSSSSTNNGEVVVEEKVDFGKYLKMFKQKLQDQIMMMTKELHRVDTQIVYFGDNDNDQPPTSTINELRKVWKNLSSLCIISDQLANERAKRDEDRFTFFTNLAHFFTDAKNAQIYIMAQREKDKQKESFMKIINKDPENSDTKDEEQQQQQQQNSPNNSPDETRKIKMKKLPISPKKDQNRQSTSPFKKIV
eukprot:TRINITY_DN806_c0_g1_i1.p1 TRINITY_DN806_c0_g1~~TRINITY_DN806_c0_g1_i1.p1  ORF type:complete len:506 (-),score=151.68 TRINITY_DN806_c0_g1_i1:119-1636(-)